MKSIVNEVLPSVDVSTTVYVALQSFKEPLTLALWPAIVTVGDDISLSEVNVTVIMSPSFARDVLLSLLDSILTVVRVGGVASMLTPVLDVVALFPASSLTLAFIVISLLRVDKLASTLQVPSFWTVAVIPVTLFEESVTFISTLWPTASVDVPDIVTDSTSLATIRSSPVIFPLIAINGGVLSIVTNELSVVLLSSKEFPYLSSKLIEKVIFPSLYESSKTKLHLRFKSLVPILVWVTPFIEHV